jgi:hypothetical protein
MSSTGGLPRGAMSRLVPALLACAQLVAASVPSGLLVNFQSSPAVGIPLGVKPQFSWVVPGGAGTADHSQTSYRIVVTDAHNAKSVLWDTGAVKSNQSIAVPYDGPSLTSGRAHNWTVQLTTANVWGPSHELGDTSATDASEPATFITALESFDAGASYIWSNSSSGIFAFFRKTVKPAKIVRATAYVTAVTDDYMMCGYKLYLGGRLVGVGPGRGEAVVWGGNGTYMKRPYVTYDVSSFMPANGEELLIAVQSLGSAGGKHHGGGGGAACAGPCAGGGPDMARGFLMQLVMQSEGGDFTTVVTDSSWDAFDADQYLKPSPGHNWYSHKLESTDARKEPIGWRFEPEGDFKAGSEWHPAQRVMAAAGLFGLHPKMDGRSVEVFEHAPPIKVEKMTQVSEQSTSPHRAATELR